MSPRTFPRLLACGQQLDTSAESFGFLRSSMDLISDFGALRQSIEEDGYLFLPGFFARERVRGVRLAICRALAKENALEPGTSEEAAIAREGLEMAFRPDLANASDLLKRLIYGEEIMAFFDGFLGGKARHYDYTWMRVVAPGRGTQMHCDIVYMGRGTPNVYTSWVPLGDVPLETGGLIILENSHRDEDLRRTYGTMDVDTACKNKELQSQLNAAGYPGFGALSAEPVDLRSKMGGRWLTAEYKMGDLLIFPMFSVHGSLDNQSREIRLSSDSRYQLACEPIDERWIGENPPAHGGRMVKGMIC